MPNRTPPPAYLAAVSPPPEDPLREEPTKPLGFRVPRDQDGRMLLRTISELEAKVEELAAQLCNYPFRIQPHLLGGDVAILLFRAEKLRRQIQLLVAR